MTEPQPVTVLVRELPFAGKIAMVALAVASLVGTVGLVSYAQDANTDAREARQAVTDARAQLRDQTIEERCRSSAAASVAQASGALLAGFSKAFETLAGARAGVRAELAQLRIALDKALAAQQQSLTNCKE